LLFRYSVFRVLLTPIFEAISSNIRVSKEVHTFSGFIEHPIKWLILHEICVPHLFELLQYLQVPVMVIWIAQPHLRNGEHPSAISFMVHGQQLLSKQQQTHPMIYYPLLSQVEFLSLSGDTSLNKK